MRSAYYELMVKYSSYERKSIETNEMSLKQQWEALKEKLIRACDIDAVSYKLDLADEKRIGKAKVVNKVITNEEAFAFMKHLNINKHNAFLLSKYNIGIKHLETY